MLRLLHHRCLLCPSLEDKVQITHQKSRRLSSDAIPELGWSPISLVMQGLNSAQQTTNLPWWAILSLAAVGIRLTLFPLTVKQLQSSSSNLSILGQAIQITKFQRKNERWTLDDAKAAIDKFRKLSRHAVAHHPAWILAAPAIQIPCFIVCVVSIRRMCNISWPGFDQGGLFWFLDLTQPTLQFSDLTTNLGPVGAVLPISIALLYLTQINLSFRRGRVAGNTPKPMAQIVRVGMEWISLPILIVTLQLPQGALVYWFSSSVYTVGQSALLGSSLFRKAVGLPLSEEESHFELMSKFTPEVMDLFLTAAESRAAGKHQEAIENLDSVLKLDPQNSRAYYAKGQVYGEISKWDEAIEAYKSSVSLEPDPKIKAKGLLGLGVAQFMKKNFDQSEKTLLEALKLDRGNLTVLMALCSLYKRSGDAEKYDAILEHAIELDRRSKQWAKHL